MIGLDAFNALDDERATAMLRPCLDVDRWVAGVVRARPFATTDDLLAAAGSAADPFTAAELEAALAHHPRLGERAEGESAEADLSRGEQAGLGIDDDVQRRLAEGNREYERRFGRVFLIRAAGRTSEEVLTALRTRLEHDPATEDAVVADELRQIAVVRLGGMVSG